MNLGAFFAALLALGPTDPSPQPTLSVSSMPATAHAVPVSANVQQAAAPTEPGPTTTTEPPAPPKPPKAAPRTAAAKKGPQAANKPAAKPVAHRKPPPRKPTTAAKPASAAKPGKPAVAAGCPAGQVKSTATGRCMPRAKAPPART